MNSSTVFRQIWRWLKNPIVATYGCLSLLFIGLVVDLNTDQRLIIAIIYNIPIVISAILLSRKLTVWTIVLSLAANLAAGYDNAVGLGETDGFTIANRVFAGLSFLLVGAMTLLFETSSADAIELAAHEQDGERERALRHTLSDLSGPITPDEMMDRAVYGLRALLHADAVVISGLDGEHFAAPRWSAPEYTSVAESGKLASWAVDALPVTATPVITVRSEAGITAVGLLRRSDADDLVVIVARPDRGRSSGLLGEALTAIEPLYERAVELERLRRLVPDSTPADPATRSDDDST